MDGLFERDLDLEADAIGLDDVQGFQRQIGAHQDFTSPCGMADQDEAHNDADGAPDQIEHAVAQGDARLAIDRTGRLGEGTGFVIPCPQPDFFAVETWPPPSARHRRFRQTVGDGVESDADDQVPARTQKRHNDLGGGVVGVGNQQAGSGHFQRQ